MRAMRDSQILPTDTHVSSQRLADFDSLNAFKMLTG